MALQRLSHIGICVSNLEKSLHFYRDVLGFQTVSELDVAGETIDRLLGLENVELHTIYLERDGTCIELLSFASPTAVANVAPRAMNGVGLTHLSMRVDDLARTLEDLRSAGVEVLEHTQIENPEFQAAAVFVVDPDSTRIELVQQPGDPNDPPGA